MRVFIVNLSHCCFKAQFRKDIVTEQFVYRQEELYQFDVV
jgi:hypothetical protein